MAMPGAVGAAFDGRGAKHCTGVKSGNSDGFPTGL